MSGPRMIMRLRIAAIADGPGGVRVIELRHPRRPALPAFTPGAHVDLHLPSGAVRQYSLCGDPAETDRYVVAVRRDAAGRGGSRWLHEGPAEGDLLPVSAPRNLFPLHEGAAPALLLGAGIGVTPLLPMAMALARRGATFAFHVFARSRAVMPLADALHAAAPPGALHLHFDDDPQSHADHAALLAAAPAGAHLYHCGPAGFMARIEAEVARAGWSSDRVHSERFGPVESEADAPFAILLPDGRRIETPVGTSALQALRAAGVEIPSNCESGLCGACVCGWTGGAPIHRDEALGAEERARLFIPCVSRASGEISLVPPGFPAPRPVPAPPW